jgi:hypothetical protein
MSGKSHPKLDIKNALKIFSDVRASKLEELG